MTARPTMTYTGAVLQASDAPRLADFYRRLLGWEATREEPGWVVLREPGGDTRLSFQAEENYVRPAWPSVDGRQRMTGHVDIEVRDLAAATEFAVEQGAELAEFQPQDHVRVCLDPDGHPFCLYVRRPEDG